MLLDDLAEQAEENEPNRREFLAQAGVASLGVATVGTGTVAVGFLSPAVLYEPPKKVSAGTLGDHPEGTVHFSPEYKLYVIHRKRRLYALSAICTHLGCMTRYQRDSREIHCPCHGSRFSLEGEVLNGPAAEPLPRFPIALQEEQLVIDRGREVGPDEALVI